MKDLKTILDKLRDLPKHDYQILFKDSPEYFLVPNSRMIQEDKFVSFVCFDDNDNYKERQWYPISNIYRIKS